MMSSEVAQAYNLAKSGEKIKAQNLLISVVKSDEKNESAWLLLATLIEPQQKKIRCLQKVLEINPNNKKAETMLARLTHNNPSKKPVEKLQVPLPVSKPLGEKKVPAPSIREIPTDNTDDSIQLTDRQILEQYVSKMTSQGWNVITLTETSVQLKKPKVWSATLLILGTLGIVVFGLGLLLIVLAVLDYALKKDEIKFTTVQELKHNIRIEHLNQKGNSKTKTDKGFAFLNDPLFWVVVVMILIFLCTLSSILN